VGGIDIDSAWSVGFNDFQPNPKKFPDLGQFVKWSHSKGVRVLLWATSLMNTDAPEYNDGLKNGFYLK
jgi:alpha-glucosidase (family GH31 glycosyl hydrolase)